MRLSSGIQAPYRRFNEAFAGAVLEGLTQQQKTIPCVWLYDRRGSELFEAITGLDEYYPTRTEIGIFTAHLPEMVQTVGIGAVVVEIGSGSSRKTPALLRALSEPHAYVPVDIAQEFVLESTGLLARIFPELLIRPLIADFNRPFELPADLMSAHRPRLCFFPGSTIGNLCPWEAEAFLRRMGDTLGIGAHMLIGVDCTRNADILLPAYDDTRGITAAFNLNILERINRELNGDFVLDHFRHQARYRSGTGRTPGRVEMHLVSTCAQAAQACGRRFLFSAGESIHTENSYKYSPAEFRRLATIAGWLPVHCWSDPQQRFNVHLLRLSAYTNYR